METGGPHEDMGEHNPYGPPFPAQHALLTDSYCKGNRVKYINSRHSARINHRMVGFE